MSSIFGMILISSLVQVHPSELPKTQVSSAPAKLFDRAIDRLPRRHTDLDGTALGKPCLHAMPGKGPLLSKRGLSAGALANSVTQWRSPFGVAPRGRSVRVAAASDPQSLLSEGKFIYQRGDRGQAYNLFERALKQDDMPLAVRQELLYCALACSAATGDLELAKQYLRDMSLAGLSLDEAMAKEEYMKMEATAGIRKAIKNFAAARFPKEQKAPRRPQAAANFAGSASLGNAAAESGESDELEFLKPENAGKKPSMSFLTDVENMGADSGEGGLDFSPGAIIQRVAILVVVILLGGAALFVFGLQFLE
eukprot:gnl/TRDRNA2_/TRDRNA2_92384_c0_seq1.p1 gnl/TRDRNA2_/TRDRNA2_92384_c0~~gnl/TRDRNA2_/TRDRNA2_92384_c0_seq1.p1  ORF type:complete len:309 (+),score=49.80 gnl/TRDRNA2_/TRDRNA2_92384_c0_seq1:59-985(+)